MLPLIDDIRAELQAVEQRLATGKIGDGAGLITAIFNAFYTAYEHWPETFRIIQLFQQQGLMDELTIRAWVPTLGPDAPGFSTSFPVS